MHATVRHICWNSSIPGAILLQSLLLPVAAGESQPTAEQMMLRAHAARAQWHDMPGFTADIVISSNTDMMEGRLTVTAEGGLELVLSGAREADWAERRLQSLVDHRLPREEARTFDVSFADDATTHPFGRLIRFHDDRLHSVYRIQDDVITEVHRTMGSTRFTISVTDVTRNAEGRHLPKSYSVSWWDAESGDLTACEVLRNEWVRIGRWDLPARIESIRTADGGQRDVGRIVLSNHRLLEVVSAD